MEPKRWLVVRGGREFGPYTLRHLHSMAQQKMLKPEETLRAVDSATSCRAYELVGLFPDAAFASDQARQPRQKPIFGTTDPSRGVEGGFQPRQPSQRSKGNLTWTTEPWHPVGLLIEAARSAIPSTFPTAASRVARIIGANIVYVTAFFTLVGGFAVDSVTDQFSAIGLSALAAVGLIFLQFTAVRCMAASERLIESNPSVLSSFAVPDSVFALSLFGTIGGSVWLVRQAIMIESADLGIAAIAVFVTGSFVSTIALHPAGISVQQMAGCTAGEDAVGLLAYAVKLVLRLAPIGFVAVMLYGTYSLVAAVLGIANTEAFARDAATVRFIVSVPMLLVTAAFPFFLYVFTALYYCSIGVLLAVLSLPAKLDTLAGISSVKRGSES